MKFATLNAFLAMGTTPSHGKGEKTYRQGYEIHPLHPLYGNGFSTFYAFNIGFIQWNILTGNYSPKFENGLPICSTSDH
jgi:hypothetical protein